MHRRTGSFWGLLLSAFACLLVSPHALAATPPVNPYLAASTYAIAHFDSSQSDTFPYAVAPGTTNVSPLAIPQLVAPISIVTLASTSPNYMWAPSATGVAYVDVSNGHFTPVARLPVPGVIQLAQSLVLAVLDQPFTAITQIQQAWSSLNLGNSGFGGVYTLVDKDNVLYAVYGNKVLAFQLTVPQIPALGISIRSSLDASGFLSSGESLVGLGLTYDGYLVVLGSRSVTVVPRDFSGTPQTVTFGSDETISNSLAADENGGIYVVSDKMMRKLVWTGSQLSTHASDGAWTSNYPTGDTFPTLFGSGSGSTPTLMGFGADPDKLVVITDGKARMGLVAFWRDQIPAGFTDRIAGQVPVTAGLPASTTYIQSDQSVSVKDYGAFVVNNISTAQQNPGLFPIDGIARGPVYASAMGVERFDWNPQTHAWSSVWSRSDVSDNSTVPTVSRASNMVFVNGYYLSSGWEVTGLDWDTGQTVHRTVFGFNTVGNGFYAMIQYMPNGDLLFNGLLGVTRVQEPGGLVLP